MLLMFAGVLSDVTSLIAGSLDAASVTDSGTADSVTVTDNVVESPPPLVVRRKRHSMAMAIDTDAQQDSDDVSCLCNC